MRWLKTSLVALALILTGAVISAQLPGPPVGIPQANQNTSHAYNFQYTYVLPAADASGFRIFPTLNLTTATGYTAEIARIGGSIVLPNSSTTATTLAALRVQIPTYTLNSGTLTNAATVLIDGDPATGTNKYGLWNKGGSRFDGALLTGTAVPMFESCGASLAAAGACPNTAENANFHITHGTFLLSGSTSTVTGITAYTSSTSWNCVANDITTRANPVQAIPGSTTTLVITNTTGATDLISVICAGN